MSEELASGPPQELVGLCPVLQAGEVKAIRPHVPEVVRIDGSDRADGRARAGRVQSCQAKLSATLGGDVLGIVDQLPEAAARRKEPPRLARLLRLLREHVRQLRLAVAPAKDSACLGQGPLQGEGLQSAARLSLIPSALPSLLLRASKTPRQSRIKAPGTWRTACVYRRMSHRPYRSSDTVNRMYSASS